jgi:hypothetical protein
MGMRGQAHKHTHLKYVGHPQQQIVTRGPHEAHPLRLRAEQYVQQQCKSVDISKHHWPT